jgi:two-component system sensor kinase FixL
MPQPDSDQHDQYIDNYKQTGQKKIIGQGREVLGKRKDDTTFPFFLSVSDVRVNEDTQMFVGVLHDITALKRAQQEIEAYTRQLEQSNQELQEFAYVSSHDLQEPLRKIQAFSDRLLKSDGETMSEIGLDYLQRILNASGRMQRLINDLLELSRISSKETNIKPIALKEIVEDVLEDLEVAIQKNNAQIQVSELPIVLGDETQYRQLFQNLISNAIKFSRHDQLPLVKIYADKAPTADFEIIYVEDNGIGIDPKYHDKVFTIFQRLNGSKYEGSGIGLAVCKKIVSRLGGNIKLSSKVNEGTQFKITLKKP